LRRKFCFLACLFSLSSALFCAQVGNIIFNQIGTLKVPKDLIDYNIHLKSGEEFSQDKLNDDIKALYDTGYFSDVEAKTATTADGKINIDFTLTNVPRIKDILIKGNDKFTTEKIMEAVRLHNSEPLVQKQLQESIANIKTLYSDNGYYEANVFPSMINEPGGDVVVTFNIQENQRIKVDNVYFTGNTVFSSWTLKDEVQTSHSYLNWVLDWGLYDEAVAKQDEMRLRNLYWTKGYLDFKTTLEVKKVEDDPDYVNVTFNITEGEPYKVGKIKVIGNTVFSEEEIMTLMRITTGEVYNYQLEEASIEAIKTKFDKLGYCDIICKADIAPDFNTHIVDIIFQITEGQPYDIRNINISGNKITKDYVIRRELPIQPGDPVNNRLIDTGKSRLMAMNYFSKVETFTTSTPVPGEKDVNYEVEEKSTAKASIGGGFSTDGGVVGRLSLTESNFDITDPSTYFRGGGQRMALLAQIGNEMSNVSLDFSEPWLFGIPLRLDASGFWSLRVFPNWNEMHLGTQWGLTKQVGNFNSVGLSYILDFVEVTKFNSNYPQWFQDQYGGWSRKGAFTLTAERDTRDDLFNPSSGYYLSGKGLFNSVAFGSDSNYYGLEATGHGYWSFFEKFLILHVGTKIATTGGLSSNNDVPIYQKYFLGGQNSLRGFEFMSVSPMVAPSMPGGGLSMWTGTIEIEHPIYRMDAFTLKGYPFVDVGNAWTNAWEYGFNMNVGLGYGLKVTVPAITSVPLRFDLGIPVSRTDSSYATSPQFYFDVGADY